jgi:hypothetical protein
VAAAGETEVGAAPQAAALEKEEKGAKKENKYLLKQIF